MGHLLGDGVGSDGDEAGAADGKRGQGEGVVAGEDLEGAWGFGDELGDLREVAAGLLDADDVGDFGEAKDGVGLEVGTGAAGDVVEQDRQVGGLGDGAEVLLLAFLAGAVVVGIGG